jgi:hypothetical protein
MTNAHCIGSISDARNTEFEFMGEESTCGATNGNCWMCQRGEIFDAVTLVKFSVSKDYALIRLANNLEANPAVKYGHLDLDDRVATIGEEIYIPQHPGARAKVCFACAACVTFYLLLHFGRDVLTIFHNLSFLCGCRKLLCTLLLTEESKNCAR